MVKPVSARDLRSEPHSVGNLKEKKNTACWVQYCGPLSTNPPLLLLKIRFFLLNMSILTSLAHFLFCLPFTFQLSFIFPHVPPFSLPLFIFFPGWHSSPSPTAFQYRPTTLTATYSIKLKVWTSDRTNLWILKLKSRK
jgi:hypothetical protein